MMCLRNIWCVILHVCHYSLTGTAYTLPMSVFYFIMTGVLSIIRPVGGCHFFMVPVVNQDFLSGQMVL